MKHKLSLKKHDALLLLIAFIYNFIVYTLARFLVRNSAHHIFITSIDNAIPFMPWTIFIYIGAYVFWGANYYLAVKYDRDHANRYILSHIIGETVCFFTFVFLPTTLVRLEITGNSLSAFFLRLVYYFDNPADNLLPSLHCFASWLCWIGVRSNKKIPRRYKIFSLLYAISICISTLTVKQHVIIDVPTGIILAEVSYLLSGFILKCIKGIKSKNNAVE